MGKLGCHVLSNMFPREGSGGVSNPPETNKPLKVNYKGILINID